MARKLTSILFGLTTILVAILLSGHLIEETVAISFPNFWGSAKKETTESPSTNGGEATTKKSGGGLFGLLNLPGKVIKGAFALIPIPTSIYPRLRYICENQDKYKSCMVKAKAITQEQGDTFQNRVNQENACPMPKDDKEMKAVLDKLGAIEEVNDILTDFKMRIPSFLKCSKKPAGKKSK